MEYDSIAPREVIDETIKNLAANGMEGVFVATKEEALEKIKEFIAPGASVMNGASVSLEQIGFVDYLKEGKHGWNNLHDGILVETDPEKKAALRRQAVLSDYYLGSVHALSQTGEFIVASNTGSQLPHIVFTSPNLIFVVGAQKIVPDMAEAANRLQKHVLPLEDARMMEAYQVHTYPSKMLMFKREWAGGGRKVRVIIVGQALGF